MNRVSIGTLDSSCKGIDYTIYQVDGVRGTLKELADYFNVDPLHVSDLLLSGVTIQDALCMAKTGFKPAAKIAAEKEKIKKEEEKKKKAIQRQKEKEKKALELKKERERKAREKEQEKAKKAQEQQEKEKQAVAEALSAPTLKSVLDAGEIVSTKAVSDVQDLGDVIIITTTTTCVYRKWGASK